MPSATAEPTTKKVPKSAMRFAAGRVQFAEQPEGDGRGEQPIKLLARSFTPIHHWYWGKIAHDLAGMQLRKDRLPLDWCHEWETNVGYAETFTVEAGVGLVASGKLVSVFDDDRAQEIMRRGAKGVPYEASIDTDPLVVEELAAGAKTTVNGEEFEGPGYVVREWKLNAIAVCPFGADSNTRAQFSKDQSNQDEVEVPIMSATKTETTKPAETPAATQLSETTGAPPAAGADPRAEFKATLDKFTKRFGAEKGAAWAAEGKDYATACELALDEAAAATKALCEKHAAEVAELTAKLKAVPRGEEEPASFSNGEGGTSPAPKKHSNYGENIDRVIAGMKFKKK